MIQASELMIRNFIVLKLMGIKPTTVIHVGSHLGQDQNQYDKLGVKEVFWCEADHDSVLQIKEKYPHSKVIEGLFWSEADQYLEFQLMKDRAQNSIYNARKPEDLERIQKLITTTIDSEFMNLRLYEPILLVLDVQGAELNVLQGAVGMLQKVSFVICEITENSSVSDFAISKCDVKNHLEKFGFEPSIKRYSHSGEYYDLLFLRKNVLAVVRIYLIEGLLHLFKRIKAVIRKFDKKR